MTTDHSRDFDARRVGWWQRRSAARQIRRSTGITAADRDLRLQSARAAQTRGELNALTRGLSPAPQALAGAATVPAPPAQQPGRPRSGSIGRTVALGAVVLVLVCGGSLVSCVSSLVDSARDSSSGSKRPSSASDLETRRGWTQMVDELDEAVGVRRVTSLAVRGRSASVVVRGDDGAPRQYYYYDGDVTARDSTGGEPGARTYDLTAIRPSVVAEAVVTARSRSGVAASAETMVDILDLGQGPRIRVTFPGGDAGVYQLVVDFAGNQVSETAAT